MAKTNLSGAKFVKFGYGQLEPNHLSARRNGKIYAQLPAKADIQMLQNGQFVKYNYAAGVVDFAGEGPWMLVFNEPKVYESRETNADFAMKREDFEALETVEINEGGNSTELGADFGASDDTDSFEARLKKDVKERMKQAEEK